MKNKEPENVNEPKKPDTNNEPQKPEKPDLGTIIYKGDKVAENKGNTGKQEKANK